MLFVGLSINFGLLVDKFWIALYSWTVLYTRSVIFDWYFGKVIPSVLWATTNFRGPGERGGEVLPKFSQIKNTERVYSVQLYNAILNGIEAIPKTDAIHDILLDSTKFSWCTEGHTYAYICIRGVTWFFSNIGSIWIWKITTIGSVCRF